MTTRKWQLCALGMLSGVLLGCGKSDWGTVTGTITLNGQPAGPGLISLEPFEFEDPNASTAGSYFGSDGKYVLQSPGNVLGAVPGTYLVRIDGSGSQDGGEEVVNRGKGSNIPQRYIDPYKTNLKATIKPGSQVIDFDLEP